METYWSKSSGIIPGSVSIIELTLGPNLWTGIIRANLHGTFSLNSSLQRNISGREQRSGSWFNVSFKKSLHFS